VGSPYSFRSATIEDVPMLRRWLETHEVRRWWGDPAEQQALIEEDLAGCVMTQLIVSLDGRPFAYAQHCEVHEWGESPFLHLPRGSRAIDPFIGEPDLLGRGHGPAFLRMICDQLVVAGTPAIGIDPDVENHRARSAYRKAGFVGEDVVETAEGPAVLMLFRSGHPSLESALRSLDDGGPAPARLD
jgi:aminoglycoside 6'-N-acetyltransferase